MGGQSTSDTHQESKTDPWAPAQPVLKGILGQVGGLVDNAGLSQTSQNAITQLQQNAQAGNPYAGQISSFTNNLLNGGGGKHSGRDGCVPIATDSLCQRIDDRE